MKPSVRGHILSLLAVSFCSLFASIAFGRGSDVTFRGPITSIQQSSSGAATLMIHLRDADLTVKVNAETDIEADGDSSSLSRLSAGDFVKVSGFFSPSGVVAKEVQILDDNGVDFRVRGQISSVSMASGGVSITVNGVSVTLHPEAQVERRGSDDPIPATSLAVGMVIDAHGKLQDGLLVGSWMRVGERSQSRDASEVRFEGQITSLQASSLSVDTKSGMTATVLLNDSTIVRGTLAQGQRVEIKGHLDNQLNTVADVVRVEDANDDNGVDANDANDDNGVDGANHDANDDNGVDANQNNNNNNADDHGNDGSGHH